MRHRPFVTPDHVEGGQHHPGGLGPDHGIPLAALNAAVPSRRPRTFDLSPAPTRPVDQEVTRYRQELRPDRPILRPRPCNNRLAAQPVPDTVVKEDPAGLPQGSGDEVF